MSTQTKPHSCSTNQCKGFFDIFLNCKLCGQKINVACLLKRDKKITSYLLYKFGVLDAKESEAGKKYYDWESKPEDKLVEDLKWIFGEDSQFGFTCEICTTKFRTSIRSGLANNAEIFTAASSDISNQVNMTQASNQTADIDLTEMIPGNISISNILPSTISPTNKIPKSPVLPVKDDNGLFSVYISKSAKNVTTDELISYIMEKTDLNVDAFHIAKLSSGKRYHKTYTSFKLTAFNVDVCKKIMASEIWSDDFRVRAFDKNRLAKVKTHHQHQRNENHRDSSKSKGKSEIRSINVNNNNKRRANNNNNNNNRNDKRHTNAQKRPKRSNNNHQNANSNHRRGNRSGFNERSGNGPQRYSYQYVPQQLVPGPFFYPPPQYHPPIQQQNIPAFYPQQYQTFAPPQMFQPLNVQHHN